MSSDNSDTREAQEQASTHKSAKTHAGDVFVTRDLNLSSLDSKINTTRAVSNNCDEYVCECVCMCVCVCVCMCVSVRISLELYARSLPNFCAYCLWPWTGLNKQLFSDHDKSQVDDNGAR